MPLPEQRPALVQAPASAGVGLRTELMRERAERPPADWPEDWWQRNYDDLLEPQHGAEPVPLAGRQLTLPDPP